MTLIEYHKSNVNLALKDRGMDDDVGVRSFLLFTVKYRNGNALQNRNLSPRGEKFAQSLWAFLMSHGVLHANILNVPAAPIPLLWIFTFVKKLYAK